MGVLGITPHERETTPWMEEVENVWNTFSRMEVLGITPSGRAPGTFKFTN
jgi:hypothetical protein